MNGTWKWSAGAVLVVTALLLWGLAASAAPPEESKACQVTYDNFGKAFLGQYCLRCHVSTKTSWFARRGAPKQMNFDNVDRVRMIKGMMVLEVATNKQMPPGKAKPTDEERAKFKEWLECEYK